MDKRDDKRIPISIGLMLLLGMFISMLNGCGRKANPVAPEDVKTAIGGEIELFQV